MGVAGLLAAFVLAKCVVATGLSLSGELVEQVAVAVGLAKTDVERLQRDAGRAYEEEKLSSEAGEWHALGAVMLAADVSEKVRPETVVRIGGVMGIARLLLDETRSFFSSDVGGALMIEAGQRPSLVLEYAQGLRGMSEIRSAAVRSLSGLAPLEDASVRMRALERTSEMSPPLAVAVAMRWSEERAESQLLSTALSDDDYLAHLTMQRGLRDHHARVLVAGRAACRDMERIESEWMTVADGAQVSAEISSYRKERDREVQGRARNVLPFVVAALGIACGVALAGAKRSGGEVQRLAGLAAGTSAIVGGGILAWWTFGRSETDLRMPMAVVVVAGIVAVAAFVAAARPASCFGAVLQGWHRGSARTARAALTAVGGTMLVLSVTEGTESYMPAAIGLVVLSIAAVVIQLAAASLAVEDLAWIGSALRGRKPEGRRTWWRRALVVLTWTAMWIALNRGPADSDATMVPLGVIGLLFVVASVVTDLAICGRRLLRRRARTAQVNVDLGT